MKHTTTLFAALLSFAVATQAQQVQFQARMGEPLPGLNAAQTTAFDDGKVEFNHILQVSRQLAHPIHQ